VVDYYEVLGVGRDATPDDIKRAYRKLARQLHPDVNGGDRKAEERFKLVTEAYDTLSDPEKKRQYDLYGGSGADGFGGQGPFAPNFSDIFQTVFGQGFGGGTQGPSHRRGEDIETEIKLSFEEAVFGVQREVNLRMPTTCPTCRGSGAKAGTSPVTCAACQGTGSVRRVTQSFLGRMITNVTCDVCHGEGRVIREVCSDCRGEGRKTVERRFVIDVPAGADNGLVLRLTGKGAAAPRGGSPGNLYAHISVAPSPRFVRNGNDLEANVTISPVQAVLGTVVEFETLEGKEEIEIAPGTQAGSVIRMRGKGVPIMSGRGRGDLVIAVVVESPSHISPEEEELWRALAQMRGESVLGHQDHGIFSKLKSAFK